MPSVQDIMEMAELLKVSSIGIEEDRCVVVRNRNATCTKCVDACIRSCITVARNELTIDADACVNCGACVAVCPTDVLKPLEPTPEALAGLLAQRSDRSSGLAVIACARKAARHEADVERYVEVPCLGHIDEVMLVNCAAAGLSDIVLVDGDCSSCKYGVVSSSIDLVVENAADILDATAAQAIITRASEFPREILSAKAAKTSFRGEDRRGLLAQTGGYVRRVASGVAKKTIDDKLGADKPKTLRDRLSAGQSGRMPTFRPQGNFSLLDGMSRLLSRQGVDPYNPTEDTKTYLRDEILDTRHFGEILIDLEKCSGCGLCVLFCPTEALCHASYDEPDDPDKKYLEFDASRCTQCRLCEDVCIRKCLKVSPRVKLAALFDLEPELIEINKPKNSVSIFDLNRNRTS